MDDATGDSPSVAATLVVVAICAPTVLGIAPVSLALIGLGFGPAAWIAVSWQLASIVTWAALAAGLLGLLRRRTDANVASGLPALTTRHDLSGVWPALLLALVVHAVVIAGASEILVLGRGRPPFIKLVLDVFVLYAPMNIMTSLGLIAAAIVAAEHRARFAESTIRLDLERQLDDAREQVIATLAALNGPQPTPATATPPEVLERIAVTSGNKTTLIPVDEIDWIEARSYYARLHVGERDYLVRQSMNALEERLDSKKFARIHRSTIVNLDRVVELRPFDRRSFVVVLRDGHRLMMSRRRRRLLDYVLP